jgi:hypothetical protein
MEINSAWCPVLRARVARLTTFEGEVTKVICPEFDASSKTCRVKKAARQGGPLSQLLDSVAEQSLAHPDTRCNLA